MGTSTKHYDNDYALNQGEGNTTRSLKVTYKEIYVIADDDS